jgi:hypothetical protein
VSSPQPPSHLSIAAAARLSTVVPRTSLSIVA